MALKKKILSDSWYTEFLSYSVVNIDEYLIKKYNNFVIKISKKIKIVRGILIFTVSKEFDIIVLHLSRKEVRTFLVLEALFSSKKNHVILLEFIVGKHRNKLLQIIKTLGLKIFLGPILNKTLAKAQVLTLHEREYYSKYFNVPIERFYFIPWALHLKAQTEMSYNSSQSENKERQQYVMVSGKNNVDWETIFEVADRSNWRLLAVCSSRHLRRVNKLNKNGRAKVLNDISLEAYKSYLKDSTVYALCLEDSFVSVGQIRLMHAIDSGVPVVATKVSGLDGYTMDGVNSILVPPNDVNAFKTSIDNLMANPSLREKLITSANEYQKSRTWENYIQHVVGLIHEVCIT